MNRLLFSLVFMVACTQESFDGYYPGPSQRVGSPDGGLLAVEAGPAAADAGGASPPADTGTYRVEERSLTSGGIERRFVLARPDVLQATPLPLVMSFHGHNDTAVSSAESVRAFLPLEAEAAGAAIFVYPRVPAGGGWPFDSDEGRSQEAEFVRELIVTLEAELGIDPARVFLVGWDGGATLVNALACRLGASVLRGVAAHSGTLYAENDFVEADSGETNCPLPNMLLVWGASDEDNNLMFETDAMYTRTRLAATLQCQPGALPWASAPEDCVTYAGCTQELVWCPIAELEHALWSGAAPAIWKFFAGHL